jgi:organic radical activating enzyme
LFVSFSCLYTLFLRCSFLCPSCFNPATTQNKNLVTLDDLSESSQFGL